MRDLITDLAALTTIPKNSLERLVTKSYSCICHNVEENLREAEPITATDIGIGTLYIKLEDNNVLYRFVPSKKLEECVTETIVNKESPLVVEVESALATRIVQTYKDLL